MSKIAGKPSPFGLCMLENEILDADSLVAKTRKAPKEAAGTDAARVENAPELTLQRALRLWLQAENGAEQSAAVCAQNAAQRKLADKRKREREAKAAGLSKR